MAGVFKKGMEKLLGKIADAELIEPLGNVLVELLSVLDIDQRTEIKIKLIPVRTRDFSTNKQERWTCIGFRKVEPDEYDLLKKQIETELKKEKKK